MARQRPRRRVMPARRRARQQSEGPKVTDWVQALAALFVIPAVWVAAVTYRDQQEINRTQQEMAQLERQRYEQRYASRVAFWWERYPARPDQSARIRLQNRSPVPIRNLSFKIAASTGPQGWQVRSYVVLADAPPCSVLTLDLSARGDDDTFWGTWGQLIILEFSDPMTWWHLTTGGLQRFDRDWLIGVLRERSPVQMFPTEVPGTREAAADCGEGG